MEGSLPAGKRTSCPPHLQGHTGRQAGGAGGWPGMNVVTEAGLLRELTRRHWRSFCSPRYAGFAWRFCENSGIRIRIAIRIRAFLVRAAIALEWLRGALAAIAARVLSVRRIRLLDSTEVISAFGVNIDHVATVRNARGGAFPDPVRAAKIAEIAGADGITAHLREDRRHISDADIERLSREIDIPLNLEMAATDEMLAIALKAKPHAACIVPEKREERTTEGGIDAAGQHNRSRAVGARAGRRESARVAVHRSRQAPARCREVARRAGRRTSHRRLLRHDRCRTRETSERYPRMRRYGMASQLGRKSMRGTASATTR